MVEEPTMTTTPIQDGSKNVLNGIHTEYSGDVVMQAAELLEQLCAARRLTEQRLAEAGRFDPIKKVTGRSSLDIAIERTEKLLEEMRALSLDGEHDGEHDGTQRPPYIEIDRGGCAETLNGNGLHADTWSRTQTQELALVR
jgi:hypothetical protein